MEIRVALARCATYEKKELEARIFEMLEASGIDIKYGTRVLVKPNLLMKRLLACTSPQVTTTVCKWLLDKGAKPMVADSPGFGSARAVSRAIGLDEELHPLGIKVQSLSKCIKLETDINGKKVPIRLSPLLFENERILSVCRLKAHSQLCLTLSVKNCFGCIPGLYKAFFHFKNGESASFFAQCIGSLLKLLPPVNGVCDGIVAMHVTGPSKGEPFHLQLLGASPDPVALDAAILNVLGVDIKRVPLSQYLAQTNAFSLEHVVWPLLRPENFPAYGFLLPKKLADVSFRPWRLFKSCCKRMAAGARS